MDSGKLVLRVVKKLMRTADILTNTDHDDAEKILEEINAIDDLVRQLVNHLSYLGALQPVGSVHISLAFNLMAMGKIEKSVEFFIAGIKELQLSKEDLNSIIDEYEDFLRVHEREISQATERLTNLG